jgi:hypothetical protein
MNLSSVFTAVAHKQLVAVDLPKSGSHQHELNGVAALRDFFGTNASTRGTLQWHYFADDREPVQEDGDFTFYDARARSADRTGRSEWRFYYDESFLERANVGDLLFLARGKGGQLFALVFQRDSAWLRAARMLFGVQASTPSFDALGKEKLNSQELELLRRQILTELGLEVALPVRRTDEEMMIAKFGQTFPTTKAMSAFARTQVQADSNRIDEALVLWLDREEELFLALERVLIRERLKSGFTEVEDFIAFSMSVHQRRKSRMGFAFQNQLAELFDHHKLRYTPQARTEGKRKPDFIFPGQTEYHDKKFDAALLVMLGVKATCKDRWRQVLVEASRIRNKHLCTLEAGISTQQTDEMREERVTLVVPASLHTTYTSGQLKEVLSVTEFVEIVRRKQIPNR